MSSEIKELNRIICKQCMRKITKSAKTAGYISLINKIAAILFRQSLSTLFAISSKIFVKGCSNFSWTKIIFLQLLKCRRSMELPQQGALEYISFTLACSSSFPDFEEKSRTKPCLKQSRFSFQTSRKALAAYALFHQHPICQKLLPQSQGQRLQWRL
jgi:hypothetical protein